MSNFRVRCYPYGKAQPIEISMDVEDGDTTGVFQVETFDLNEYESDLFKNTLYGSAGIYGHLIVNAATPIDLYHALVGDDVEVLEGEELLEDYGIGYPRNVQS